MQTVTTRHIYLVYENVIELQLERLQSFTTILMFTTQVTRLCFAYDYNNRDAIDRQG